MSRWADEKKARPKARGVGNPKETKSNLLVYRPDKAAKDLVTANWVDWEKVGAALCPVVERGHKFTLGWTNTTNSFFATMRDGNAPWDEAVSVSCWHADPLKAMAILAFYLTEVNNEFPEGAAALVAVEANDW